MRAWALRAPEALAETMAAEAAAATAGTPEFDATPPRVRTSLERETEFTDVAEEGVHAADADVGGVTETCESGTKHASPRDCIEHLPRWCCGSAGKR